VEIIAGQHNTIQIQSPQGSIRIAQPGHTEYQDGITVLVKRPNGGPILTNFALPGTEKLLVGKYDIECTTLPLTVFKNVEINQSQNKYLEIAQPGVVNFIATAKGIGSLYQIHENGTQTWIYNLDQELLGNTIAIQPGKYKVVFRSENAKGSKFTTINEFEIKPGSSINIRL
jgi:Ca-activated chloride channel family protein